MVVRLPLRAAPAEREDFAPGSLRFRPWGVDVGVGTRREAGADPFASRRRLKFPDDRVHIERKDRRDSHDDPAFSGVARRSDRYRAHRPCARTVAGAVTDLAAAAGADRRSLCGGRKLRLHGADRCAAPERSIRSAIHRREPPRRQWRHRQRGGRARPGRRLHAAVGRDATDHHRAGDDQGVVRSSQGLCADQRGRDQRIRAARQQGRAGEKRRRVRRPCARATQQARLCRGQRRQPHAPLDGAVPQARRARHDECELPRQRAGADRRHRRPPADHVLEHLGRAATRRDWRGAAARGIGRASARRSCPMCRRLPSPAFRDSTC